MAVQRSFATVVFAAIAVFGAVLGGSIWWGKYRANAIVRTPTHELDKVDDSRPASHPRASHGSEPQTHDSEPPERRPAPNHEPANPTMFHVTERAAKSDLAVPDIRAKLELIGPDAAWPERVELEATLGYALLKSAQPDLPGAGTAFCSALDHTPTPDLRVPMARDFGEALLAVRGNAEVLHVTDSGRFIGAELTAERFQIETIRGIAYEELGLSIRAQDTFREGFDAILNTELHDTDYGRDAARTLALRLARKYRDAGDPSSEEAVSRKLRAWLGEDSLALR